MPEHRNGADGARDEANSQGIGSPSPQRRRVLAMVAGGLLCGTLVCAAWLIARGHLSLSGTAVEDKQIAAQRGAAVPPGNPAAPQESAASPAHPDVSQPTPQAVKDEAFAVIRQLIADFPGDPEPVNIMGTFHMKFSETAEAEQWCRKCLEQHPLYAPAYHGLAVLATMKGDQQKAVELWRTAHEISPDLPGVYGMFAETLLAMGRSQEAAAAIEKEIKLSGGRGKYYAMLGQAHMQQRQYEKAAECYQKTVEMCPLASEPCYGLASACAKLGQANKAQQYMKKFQALRDEEERRGMDLRRGADDCSTPRVVLAEAHNEAGRLYAVHRRMEEAEPHWRRAASLDPRNTPSREALVDLCRLRGELPAAAAIAEELRQAHPEIAAYHLLAGGLLAELRRFDAAEAALRQALELAPAQPPVSRMLVRFLLARNQKLSEARTLAEQLVVMQQTAENYSLLGEVRRRTGDLDGARQALRQAMDLESANRKNAGRSATASP